MRRSLFDSFWSKVHEGPHERGCWIWTGARDGNGYGYQSAGKKLQFLAHRLAWELAHRVEIPAGLVVRHDCDTPSCVNPAHLRLGTMKENSEDMVRRGRSAIGQRNGMNTRPDRRSPGDRNGSRTHPERLPRGEKRGNVKLTADAVLAIRERYMPGPSRYARAPVSQAALAREFGVTQSLISHVLRRKSWTHLPEASP